MQQDNITTYKYSLSNYTQIISEKRSEKTKLFKHI